MHVPACLCYPYRPFQMPFAVQVTRCPKCNQPVYHAEEVAAAGKKWHKTCFKCGKMSNLLLFHFLSFVDCLCFYKYS
jgi:predicted nucleic-acid-binding Zn-ribbon protein